MAATLEAGHAGPNPPGHSAAVPGSAATSSVTGSSSTTSRASLSASDSTSSSTQTSPYHTHRQNHNSSKLPAFRFADLQNKQQSLTLPSPQHHQQQQQYEQRAPSPTTPGSPNQSRKIAQSGNSSPQDPLNSGDLNGIGPVPARTHHHSVSSSGSGSDHDADHQNSPRQHAIGASPPRVTTHQAQPPHHHQIDQHSQHRDTDVDLPPRASPRSRASTYQGVRSSAGPAPAPAASSTRPASLDSPVNATTTAAAPSARTQYRRAPASRASNGSESASGAPLLNSRRQTSLESNSDFTTKEWAQGQRELVLPKSLATQATSPTDEKRQPTRSRPPLSFRKPSTPAVSVRVAPIRSFRSSGSRRSFGLDMNSSPIHAGDSSGDDYGDPNHRDRTLRALEGRSEDEMLQTVTATSLSRRDASDADDTTGDVFMKIARQEGPGPRAGAEDPAAAADQTNAISRVTRSSHRRPLSTNIPSSYQPTSPQRPRRLSDQESTRSRSRQVDDDASTDIINHIPYRGLREKAASAHPGEDLRLARLPGGGNRASPLTPRSYAFQDSSTENPSYARRRTSITESNGGYSARNPAYRHSTLTYGQPRTFNSSPLAPRTAEPPRHDYNHLEGTESTASTTAPSTVWDELDEIKSRIHRLELTGKLPSTSSAAMHKALDERPPTATNTTVSTSPKQTSGNSLTLNDASSTTSSQKETQPLLVSALNRSKGVLSDEVNEALESAVTDAVALLAMMGTAGMPGPISSGASTIGAGGTLTDRQLRRRAEGICRSLTGLVIQLNDEATNAQAKTVSVQTSVPRNDGPTTPTLTKAFPTLQGGGHQRRGSVTTTDQVERPNSIPSPRAMSKLEERRSTMLNSSALPSPRFAQASNTPLLSAPSAQSAVGRKSSLLISRTRRAATEEPEDGRRSSMLLRTRRAGTEEPEEGRTTSLLRERKTMLDVDGDDAQFRPPSRAATDVNAFRAVSHQYPPNYQQQDTSSGASSGLPRRRVGSSMLGSRLASPSTLGSALSGRRFLERSTPDRDGNSVAEKLAEERGQRHGSQGPSLLSRTTSLLRRPNRESTITNASTSAQAGGYR